MTRHRWPDRCGYATYPPIPGDEETMRRVGAREAAERLAAAGLRDCTHEARAPSKGLADRRWAPASTPST